MKNNNEELNVHIHETIDNCTHPHEFVIDEYKLMEMLISPMICCAISVSIGALLSMVEYFWKLSLKNPELQKMLDYIIVFFILSSFMNAIITFLVYSTILKRLKNE